MSQQSSGNDSRFAQQPTRRAAMIATGTTLAGIGGLTLLGHLDKSASVRADVNDLAIDGTEETVDGEPAAVMLSLSGDYEYRIPDDVEELTGFRIELFVSYNGTEQRLAEESQMDISEGDSGPFAFDVDLLEHDALSAGDMVGELGETVSTEFTVAVDAQLIDNGGVVDSHRIEDTVTVVLTADGFQVDVSATGSVSTE